MTIAFPSPKKKKAVGGGEQKKIRRKIAEEVWDHVRDKGVRDERAKGKIDKVVEEVLKNEDARELGVEIIDELIDRVVVEFFKTWENPSDEVVNTLIRIGRDPRDPYMPPYRTSPVAPPLGPKKDDQDGVNKQGWGGKRVGAGRPKKYEFEGSTPGRKKK